MKTSIFISSEQIQKRVKQLGLQISKDLKGEDDIVFLCVLKGGFIFFTDLIRYIDHDIKCDFIQISSYVGSKSTNKPAFVGQLTLNLENKAVVVVEDIVDSGVTMNFLIKHLKIHNPKSIRTATLLDKKEARTQGFTPDYIAFEIPEHFVVGYGLDYNQKLRNLPYIAKFEEGSLN